MKTASYFIPIVVLAATMPTTARAASFDLPSTPTAVTVYNDQATVTRIGEIDIPAGDSALVLHNIPIAVLRDTVTASAKASTMVTLGAVETRQEGVDPAVRDQRRADLAVRIRGLGDQIAAIDARAAGFKAQQDFVESLAGGLIAADPDAAPKQVATSLRSTPERWKSAWGAIREGVTEAAEGQRLAAHERADLADKRAALQAELDRLGTPDTQALQALVTVHADRPAHLQLRLSYQVPGASWYPVYEVRLDTVGTPALRLRQEAVVTQSTGEDWSDVALTLSTTQPSQRTAVPELSPWNIDLAPLPGPQSAADAAPMAMAAPAPAFAMAARQPRSEAMEKTLQEAAVVQARIAQTGLSVEYVIPARSAIASDGSERRVRINDVTDNAAVLSVVAVPQIEATAYLQARLEDGSPAAYLPGTVSLFLDGVFVGKSDLPLVQPHDHATLSFGADNRVKVTYQPQGKLSSRDGIIWDKKSVESHAALITIANHHDQAIPITVLDQAPVSGDADLKVEIKADPAPTRSAVDDKPGVVAWDATYQPGESRQIRFGYAVSAPEGRPVVGLR